MMHVLHLSLVVCGMCFAFEQTVRVQDRRYQNALTNTLSDLCIFAQI